MSMAKFIDAMKLNAAAALKHNVSVKIGLVTSYNRNRYAVRVSLQPEEVVTGWLPIFSPMVGNGWGFIAPPGVGTVAAVLFVDGQIDAGFVCLFGFGQVYRPPANDVEPGGFLFYTKAGANIKVSATGDVEIKAAAGRVVSVASDTSISLGSESNSFLGLVTGAFKEVYNSHTHPSDNTPPNTGLMTDGHVSDILKGN